MAEKRMISKCISISEKVNLLPDILDMLLFTWLIPHTDDFGRLTGSPAKVKALVVPMLDKTASDVEASLARLHEAELILWYEINRDKYIQIINFEEHQQGLHKRTKSKIPEFPGNSGKFQEIPLEGKGRELKGIGTEEEEKGREQIPASDLESIKTQLFELVRSCNIKAYTLFELDKLYSYIGMVDVEVIEAAIKKATNKDHINYAINTLNGMIKDGVTQKEHLFSKPKAGEFQRPITNRSGKPHMTIVDGGASVTKSAEERAAMRAMVQQLENDKAAP